MFHALNKNHPLPGQKLPQRKQWFFTRANKFGLVTK